MSLLAVYLLFMLPSVGHLAHFIAVVFTVVSTIIWVVKGASVIDSSIAKITKGYILFPCLAGFFGLLSALIPSDKQIYTIVGAYYVTNIEGIADIPPNVVGAMNKFLEEYAKEVSTEDKKPIDKKI